MPPRDSNKQSKPQKATPVQYLSANEPVFLKDHLHVLAIKNQTIPIIRL